MANVYTGRNSLKSYADVVKLYRPPHPEVIKAYRPLYSEVIQSYSLSQCAEQVSQLAATHTDEEERWTEVSSVTSCSWPSTLASDETNSSHGNEHIEYPHEVCGIHEEPWHDGVPDTRTAAARASMISNRIRGRRLHDELAKPLECSEKSRKDKHWHSYSRCHPKEWRESHHWPAKLKHLKRRMMRTEISDGKMLY